MLDRMHNTADRDTVPQKRRKVAADIPENVKKANFNGAGRGGMLGDYIKEQKSEDRKESGSKGVSVDLSGCLTLSVMTNIISFLTV